MVVSVSQAADQILTAQINLHAYLDSVLIPVLNQLPVERTLYVQPKITNPYAHARQHYMETLKPFVEEQCHLAIQTRIVLMGLIAMVEHVILHVEGEKILTIMIILST